MGARRGAWIVEDDYRGDPIRWTVDLSGFVLLSSLSKEKMIDVDAVGISRSLRDFQVPVETVLWFPWGRHFHSHLRHRLYSADLGGCCTLPACRSSLLQPPVRSFSIRRPVKATDERILA